MQEPCIQRGIKHTDAEKIILISISAWRMGCRRFTLERHVGTTDIQVTSLRDSKVCIPT